MSLAAETTMDRLEDVDRRRLALRWARGGPPSPERAFVAALCSLLAGETRAFAVTDGEDRLHEDLDLGEVLPLVERAPSGKVRVRLAASVFG